jgi:hypothetical protein
MQGTENGGVRIYITPPLDNHRTPRLLVIAPLL